MITDSQYDIVASVVLFKNNKLCLERVINSFFACKLKKKLVFVDNSPDDFLHLFVKKYPEIDYVKTKKNLGYGGGHNIAITKYLNRTRYHLILNPDIEFKEDVLEDIQHYMEKNRDIGLLMPKIVDENGVEQKLCKLLPTPFNLFARRFMPNFLQERFNYKYELRFADYNSIMDIPNLSGCFMFLRNSSLKKVGLFDEKFFMYLEDIDLSRRIHAIFRTVFYPKVEVIHGHQKASFKSFRFLKIHILSAIKYFNKWGWCCDMDRKRINKQILSQL